MRDPAKAAANPDTGIPITTPELLEVDLLSDEQRAHYLRCREKGTAHSLAMILATGKAPLADRRDERWRRGDAHEAGVKNVRGKYQSALARYPGDPRAVVQSRGEARKRAEELGFTITDRPENAGVGRNRLVREARRGNAEAARLLEKD